jgi:hypothetical protein
MVEGGLNYAGVCLAQKRFLPEAEKIQLAVTYTNASSVVPVRVSGHETRLYKSIPYTGAEDLINNNPHCCRITVGQRWGDEGAPPDFLSRAFGLYVGDVRIDYVARYRDEQGNQHSYPLKRIVILGNCGAINND